MTARDWLYLAILVACGLVVLAVLWLAPCTVAQRSVCSAYIVALTWLTLIGRAEVLALLPTDAAASRLEQRWDRKCPHCLRPVSACNGEDRSSGFLFDGCLERRDREAAQAASVAAAEAQQAGEPVVIVTQSGEL